MRRLLLTALLVVGASAQQPYPPPYGQQGQYPQGQYPQYPAPQNGPLPGADGYNQPGYNQPGYDDDGYAPDHGVARLSFMGGNVSVVHGDQGELAAAALNAPLTASDRVVTAGGSRAEIQFDSNNVIRLGQSTEVRLSELQYGRYQIQIATGFTVFRVERDPNGQNGGQVEISTPSVSVHPLRRGTYRVVVQPDGSTEITVRSGEAEIASPRGSEQLRAGQTMLVRGAPSDPEFQIVGRYPDDEFDRWSDSRDAAFERSVSSRYVSPDVYGAEDLDSYGRWANDPEYGNVWVPQVDADWAPYQNGRWSYIDYYGWSWVGNEPWGWAPYHYGNWYNGSLGWAWYPGPIRSHNYWRPALVGFFGWGGRGNGGGFGFGYEHVGWVPLAPRERYSPWYGRRGSNFSIANNSNVFNNYRNARFRNGITGVRASDFGHAGVNRSNFVRPSAGDLSRAGAVRGQLPLQPSRESRNFSDRQVSAQGFPRSNQNTQFFSARQAPRQGRQGFQQSAPQPGFSGGNGNIGNGNNGWRRMDSPARSAGASQIQPQIQPQTQPQVQRQQPSFERQQGFNQNRGFERPQAQPRVEQPRIEQPRIEQPRFERQARNIEQPRNEPQRNFTPAQPRNFGGSPGPVRINPPIVQQRSAPQPRTESPRGNGGGGGQRAVEAPRGGGGGGGNRGGGGGGGGNHGGNGGGHGNGHR